jgi:hypothetical protein
MSELLPGIVVLVGNKPAFVPASVAQRIVRRPVISWVPGAPLGMALIAGRVVPVVEIGDGSDALVCEVEGEPIALAGVSGVRSGFFEATEQGVDLDGERVALLVVEDAVRGVQQTLRGRFAT